MPRAFGSSLGTAKMRVSSDDFQVDEVLGFEPDGDGEHLLVHVKKRDTNTQWLAGQLARFAGIPARDISYAGLKDRHAVTTQWFSIRLAGKPEPDWSGFTSEQVELLAVHRHRRKLRRGALRGNRFQVTLRHIEAEKGLLEKRLEQMRVSGMPNYFGEQRFGHGYQNLHRFADLLGDSRRRVDRQLRGLLISAVRSQLFNQVLAERIKRQIWASPLPGDYFKLDGSRSGFRDDPDDEHLRERCLSQDIHPTGPLFGRGTPQVEGDVASLEQEILAPFTTWREGLEQLGLEQERRALRVRLDDLQWQFSASDTLTLTFFLPAGAFATALLRELMDISSPAVR
ncbi:MAG: tRNA pseudouridine(13) synthase TruD [Candidatus Thiodiazotropha sp. (ex Notomyrtea botanica)]|nr:tRNA pseudouridine(13) synthase TruD [Candidatus Thiodiazotropha sp. (ex Notomyrtea botanica)]